MRIHHLSTYRQPIYAYMVRFYWIYYYTQCTVLLGGEVVLQCIITSPKSIYAKPEIHQNKWNKKNCHCKTKKKNSILQYKSEIFVHLTTCLFLELRPSVIHVHMHNKYDGTTHDNPCDRMCNCRMDLAFTRPEVR